MKNRRLLIILLVFICLGTLTVLGGTLFSVRTVTVRFSNHLEFYTDASDVGDVESKLRESILPVTMHRNNLFQINDRKVREAMENSDARVRVTNIERKFPNEIEITVQERYPVYWLQVGDKTAVICGRLRVLDILDAPGLAALQSKAKWSFIEMPSQIRTELDFADLKNGDFLTDRAIDNPHIKVLKQIVPHLARFQAFEDTICHVFESISFAGTPGNESFRLIMTSRSEPDVLLKNYFQFVVWDAETNRLTDMLTKAWEAVNAMPDKVAIYQMWLQDIYITDRGVVLPIKDGILIGITDI